MNWIKDYLNFGSLPDLSEEEIDAIIGHRRGDQSHLLEENVFIFENGLIITKSIDENLDIPFFVNRVMEACGDSFKIYIGKVIYDQGYKYKYIKKWIDNLFQFLNLHIFKNKILDFHGFFKTEKNEKFFQFGSRNSSFISENDDGFVVSSYDDRVYVQNFLKSKESEFRNMWFSKHSEISYTPFEASGVSPDREVSLLISICRVKTETIE